VGVHLTRRSIAADDARAFLGKDALIGVSTHALCEAQEAERLGADFVTFGPVFETPSKRAYGPPLGLEALKSVVSALSIPVFALGGVTCERLPALAATGVHGIAMISAILGGTHPAAIRDAAEELVTRWQGRAREGKPAPRGTPDAGHP
ncbi:MAG: thiamine phosphate synthase, partial [Deltaproteobacteria bacterium]